MNKLFILTIFFFFSCSDHFSREENVRPVTQLQAEIVEKLSDRGVFNAWGISKVGDQFLIRSSSGVVAVPCERKTLSRSAENEGKGVILYDFMQGKVMEYSAGQKGNIQSHSLAIPEKEQHLSAIKGENFIISTGIYEIGRYLYTPDAGEAKYFLSYPESPDYPDMTEKVKSILYASCVLRIRPDERSFVGADMYSGTIDFCRIENGKIELVKRVCLHAPEVRVQGTAHPKVRYTKTNLMGFTDVAVSEDRVYALHSGKSFREAGNYFSACEELLIFDWDGNLLERCHLPAPVTTIDYSSSENCIYAVENGRDVSLLRINLSGKDQVVGVGFTGYL